MADEQPSVMTEFETLLMTSKVNLGEKNKARTRFINRAKALFIRALQAVPAAPEAPSPQPVAPTPPPAKDSDRMVRITSPAIERMKAGLPKGTMVMTQGESARTDKGPF